MKREHEQTLFRTMMTHPWIAAAVRAGTCDRVTATHTVTGRRQGGGRIYRHPRKPGPAATTHRWIVAAACALVALAAAATAAATPQYMARSGRTCDNCHTLPNTWFNPDDTSLRKCTLSCSGCHVDPSGGGLRTVSGRYFDEATLPMFGSIRRPLDDRRRTILAWINGEDEPSSEPSSAPSSEPASGPAQPATSQIDPRPPGSPAATLGPAFGHPAGDPAEMAWLDGRYGDLAADPLLLVGGDLRLGYWQQGNLVFPMQLDFHAAVHPMEHVTVATSVGARGRTKGFAATVDQPEGPPVVAKDLYLMTHEYPYLGYARVGRFMPGFGTRVADHTAPIRRAFGVSQESPDTRVVGAEVGFTANYPYANVSLFKPVEAAAANPLATADGWGGVVSVGYRELPWSIGASAMVRRRPLDGGGDTNDLSLHWSFNPWFYERNLAITYLGEVAVGQLQRPYSGRRTLQEAWYHSVNWVLVSGVTLDLRHDYWDPDRDVAGDEIHRPGAGLELVFVPGLAVRADARVGLPAGGQAGADLFVQLHGWF